MTPDVRALLLESVSDRVLRHLSPSLWRELFLDGSATAIALERRPGTLLCAHLHSATGSRAGLLADIQSLAAYHGGQLDPCPDPFVLAYFDDADDALQMALDLEQLASGARFQVGLATGECVVACLPAGGRQVKLFVGAEVERVCAVSQLAPAGSVRIAAETLPLVNDRLETLSTWLVTTEWTHDDAVCAASLSLPPRATEQLSTFAGLGLV